MFKLWYFELDVRIVGEGVEKEKSIDATASQGERLEMNSSELSIFEKPLKYSWFIFRNRWWRKKMDELEMKRDCKWCGDSFRIYALLLCAFSTIFVNIFLALDINYPTMHLTKEYNILLAFWYINRMSKNVPGIWRQRTPICLGLMKWKGCSFFRLWVFTGHEPYRYVSILGFSLWSGIKWRTGQSEKWQDPSFRKWRFGQFSRCKIGF